jgi:hypothetical protein
MGKDAVMREKHKICIVLISVILQAWAGSITETIKAFERRPDYVRPFATMVGSLTNSGWSMSSTLNKKFNFSVGIPISLTYLNDQDRQYSGTYSDDGCVACQKMKASNPAVDCKNCVECQQFTAPTIFGSIHTPDVHRSIVNLQGTVIDTLPPIDPFSDGIKELNAISVLPFLTLQTSFSYYYSELTLRYIGIPAIGGVSFQFPGIGFQHNFNRFFPSLPVSLSIAAHFTLLNASWAPTDSVKGTLDLSGLSSFYGVLIGYKAAKFLEVFLETGWDNCSIKPTGEMTIINTGEKVRPNTTISGRNGFRAALNFSFPIRYNPVIGGTAGAQFGNLINILSYKSKNE